MTVALIGFYRAWGRYRMVGGKPVVGGGGW